MTAEELKEIDNWISCYHEGVCKCDTEGCSYDNPDAGVALGNADKWVLLLRDEVRRLLEKMGTIYEDYRCPKCSAGVYSIPVTERPITLDCENCKISWTIEESKYVKEESK